jgi:4-hydroxy-tetrahydrodipicolinate reductase
MKIALIGYGKMGKAIEEIALQRGHDIVLRIGSSNRDEMSAENLQQAEVAIEFTRPEAARENVMDLLNAGVPTVCGTTGWNEGLNHAKMKASDNDTSFLWASNFSVGVNIFFEVNKFLASLMNTQADYEVSIEETHHTQKKDAPSGTAISLAEQILEKIERKKHWTKEQAHSQDDFPIVARRIDNIPGTHKITYHSPIDDIEIIHTAHNRQGFALGAVLAAEFIAKRKGVFTMQDVLGIKP